MAVSKTDQNVVNIFCDNCLLESNLQSRWWCHNCNEIVCSFCAMSNHCKHDCSIWNEQKLVEETFKLFEPYSNYLYKNVDKQIDDFFCKLAKELKIRLDTLNETANFVKVMETMYGTHLFANANTDSKQEFGPKNEKQLLIMRAILSHIDKGSSFDVDQIIEALKSSDIRTFIIPNASAIADLFFKWKEEKSSNTKVSIQINSGRYNVRLKQTSLVKTEQTAMVNKSIQTNVVQCNDKVIETKIAKHKQRCDAVKKSTLFHKFHIQTQKAPLKLTLNWWVDLKILRNIQNPANLCAIPNVGVVTLDSSGVHLLAENGDYKQFAGWPIRPAAISCGGSDFQISITYHPGRKSIFFLKEGMNNNGVYNSKIIELNVPSLTRRSTIMCPSYHDDNKPQLGVSNTGYIICATSSLIVTIDPDFPIRQQTVWSGEVMHDDIENFNGLVVSKLKKQKEYLYFASTSAVFIFEFRLLTNECNLLKSVNNIYPPIFVLKNVVYGLSNEKEMISISPGSQQGERIIVPLEIKRNGKILVSSDYRSVYVFNYQTNFLSKYETGGRPITVT